jgi:cyclophilin family peptidyl-prolyl cis-trans isomerase
MSGPDVLRRSTLVLLLAAAGAAVLVADPHRESQKPAPPSGPVLIMDTVKGTIEIQLFQADAPKSVAHLAALAGRNFYRGLRIHRVTPTIVQWGDPMSRDVSRIDYWGTGGSGNPIGVAELSKRRTHQRGTVALAHAGRPELADSQLFILKAASPGLDGKHVIVGQVSRGMAVVDRLARADVIKNITVK